MRATTSATSATSTLATVTRRPATAGAGPWTRTAWRLPKVPPPIRRSSTPFSARAEQRTTLCPSILPTRECTMSTFAIPTMPGTALRCRAAGPVPVTGTTRWSTAIYYPGTTRLVTAAAASTTPTAIITQTTSSASAHLLISAAAPTRSSTPTTAPTVTTASAMSYRRTGPVRPATTTNARAARSVPTRSSIATVSAARSTQTAPT
mmetsp:Transcript_11781/g.33167  ORF Transcript_11781/g.33167 Transcript_11781/m.33167 type:complete len:206 (-) Transcript_11781:2377-2994(-)